MAACIPRMGGGNQPVIIHQHIQVGSFATRAEMLQMGQVIERSARNGAKAELVDGRRRNGPEWRR